MVSFNGAASGAPLLAPHTDAFPLVRARPGLTPTSTAAVARTAAATSLPTLIPTPTTGPTKTSARYIDPVQIAADPNRYIGSDIILEGDVQTVEGRPDVTWVVVQAGRLNRPGWQGVVVRFAPHTGGIYKGVCYRIYASVQGTEDVLLRPSGVTVNEVLLRGYAFDQRQRDLGDCAPSLAIAQDFTLGVMPNTVGLDRDTAVTYLTEAGITHVIECYVPATSLSANWGRVAMQDPAPDALVPSRSATLGFGGAESGLPRC